jgi:hypothetical protein
MTLRKVYYMYKIFASEEPEKYRVLPEKICKKIIHNSIQKVGFDNRKIISELLDFSSNLGGGNR